MSPEIFSALIALLGVVIGYLTSFLTQLFMNKWQRENDIRKEKHALIEKRLDEVDRYLIELVEKINDVRTQLRVEGTIIVESEFKSEGNITVTIEYEDAYEELRKLVLKLHITDGLKILSDVEIDETLKSFVREVSRFAASVQYIVVTKGKIKGSVKKVITDQLDQYIHSQELYSKLKERMDLYRLQEIRTKKQKN